MCVLPPSPELVTSTRPFPPRRLARFLIGLVVVPLVLGALVIGAFRVVSLRRESEPRKRLAPATGRFVKAADLEIYIQEAGPADGPPVLLVHGTGAWSAIWRETMDALAAKGYRAIAIDLPPFGFSERPPTPQYGDAPQAARIVGVLDALDIKSVTLIGHSFGARPTVEAALLDPSRVRLLVLVDAALSPSTDARPAPAPAGAVRTIASTPWLRDPLIAATMTNPLLTRKLLQQLILDPADATDAQVEMVHAQFRLRGTTPAYGMWLEQFVIGGEASLGQDASRYATLGMPVLLLWGQEDTITPLARAEALKKLLPSAELVTLPRTGHIPTIENPQAFREALLRFLDAHAPSPPAAMTSPRR